MQDDGQLLNALRAGDPDAFAALFNLYSGRMFRLAAGILNDDDLAEGVVQEVFLRLIERLDRFEGRARLGTWLYRAAYNASIDRLRRRRPQQPLADDLDAAEEGEAIMPAILVDWSTAPEELLTSEEARQQINAAIQALPVTLRSVFILREVDGLSTAEAAEALGISEGALKVRLHRARLLLREALSGYFAERLANEGG